MLVTMGVFGALLGLTRATKIAIKAQYAIFAIIIVSLISVFMGGGTWFTNTPSVPTITSFQKISFWPLFALFFPAVSGLMAGIGLSGELSDPKKQIPRGVLLAILITTIFYVVAVFWLGSLATPEELKNDTNIMIKLAFVPQLVLA